MQKTLSHIKRILMTWFIYAGMSFALHAQESNPAYRFEGTDCVFTFDIRNYAKELLGENALKVDFADLGVHEVAITGDFNNWSKKGWKMQKKDEFTFELRKPITEFNDPFPIEFRYIINGRFIANPEGDVTDPRQFKDDFIEDIYKLDLSVIKITDEGNVAFELAGYTHCRQVILAGSFNGWNEHEIKMNKTTGGWFLMANLPPGRYEYKFIADGEWLHDPRALQQVLNEHGTLNSVLFVTVPVTFELKGFSTAKKVILAGSFNEWNENKDKMKFLNGAWTSTLELTGGKHTYKFIVDGQWMTDPENPLWENDGYGNINSVLFVH